jgi:hypothetical protein
MVRQSTSMLPLEYTLFVRRGRGGVADLPLPVGFRVLGF